MTRTFTTVDDGRGGYRDARLPNLELRWEGETFELWVIDHPAASHPAMGDAFLQRGRGTRAQEFRIFTEAEAAEVGDPLAHAVAQCIFDVLGHSSPAWVEHVRRFGEHEGCTIETTCEVCACCSTAGEKGCACAHCRCGQPGGETGHPLVPMEQAVLAAAKRLMAS